MKVFFVVLACALMTMTAATCGQDKEAIEDQNDAARDGGRAPDARIGDRDVFSLRAGDCIAETFSSVTSETSSTEVVSCSSPRAFGRVTNLFLVERSSGPYPGEAYFDNQMDLGCDLAATAFYFPTTESWAAGDRTVTCIEEFP